MIEVYTLDTAVLAALEAATANDPLYQKAHAARAIAAAAAATAATLTAAGAAVHRPDAGVLPQEVALGSESIYGSMDPAVFREVLNW
jgi:hypothetical protein